MTAPVLDSADLGDEALDRPKRNVTLCTEITTVIELSPERPSASHEGRA